MQLLRLRKAFKGYDVAYASLWDRKRSSLFSGEAVGLHIDDPPGQIIATEKFMRDSLTVIPPASDVLIAPHHGSDTASSGSFIGEVRPRPLGVYFGGGVPLASLLRACRHRHDGGTEIGIWRGWVQASSRGVGRARSLCAV